VPDIGLRVAVRLCAVAVGVLPGLDSAQTRGNGLETLGERGPQGGVGGEAGARGRWGVGGLRAPGGPGGAPGACERVGPRAGQGGGPRPRRAGGGTGGLDARGRAANCRPRCGGTCSRVECGHALSWVAPRNFTPAPVGAVALGTLSAAVGAAVWWMRGHSLPPGGGGRGDACCRRCKAAHKMRGNHAQTRAYRT